MRKHIPVLVAVISAFAAACTAALFYRDEDGDEYVTRPSDFSSVPDVTSNFVKQQDAVGGDHIEASVGECEVEQLNALIVRLISENIE